MSSHAILQDSNVPATGDMLCVQGLGAPGYMKTWSKCHTLHIHTRLHMCLLTYRYIHTYIPNCIHIGIHMHTYKHTRVDTCDVRRGLTCNMTGI